MIKQFLIDFVLILFYVSFLFPPMFPFMCLLFFFVPPASLFLFCCLFLPRLGAPLHFPQRRSHELFGAPSSFSTLGMDGCGVFGAGCTGENWMASTCLLGHGD